MSSERAQRDPRGLFAGKVVMVTGSGSGLGRGLAHGFAADGAQVVGFGRNLRDLQETAASARPDAPAIHAIQGDLGQPEDIDALFDCIEATYGRVDVLINNAALYPKLGFLECDPALWGETLRVNVIGLAHCCRRALPLMLKHGHGRILNVGSFAWKGPIPKSSDYSASKAAVSAFTKAIAGEIDRGAYPDLLINEFIPGIVRSRMSDEGEEPADVYPHARFATTLPSGGPHGVTLFRSAVVEEHRASLLGKLRRAISSVPGRLRGR